MYKRCIRLCEIEDSCKFSRYLGISFHAINASAICHIWCTQHKPDSRHKLMTCSLLNRLVWLLLKPITIEFNSGVFSGPKICLIFGVWYVTEVVISDWKPTVSSCSKLGDIYIPFLSKPRCLVKCNEGSLPARLPLKPCCLLTES